MKDLIGKSFLIDEEEWVVEEILLYGHRCSCRSYYSDDCKQFYIDYIQDKVDNYESEVKKLEKKRNAFVFIEDDEKELLSEMIKYYCENKPVICFDDKTLGTLIKITKQVGVK